MTAKKTIDVLKAARDLISDRSRWTTGDFAKDADGLPVPAASPDAVCWCSVGAIYKAADERGVKRPKVYDALHAAAKPRIPWMINDHDGHKAALALLDLAIAQQETP